MGITSTNPDGMTVNTAAKNGTLAAQDLVLDVAVDMVLDTGIGTNNGQVTTASNIIGEAGLRKVLGRAGLVLAALFVLGYLARPVWGQEPTPGLTPEPTTEAPVYVVVPGDTLYGIAQRFGTTVEAIVEDEAQRYRDEGDGKGVLPVLDAVRRKAEDSRRSEIARFIERSPHVPAELREEIEALSRSLVNTILAAPSQCLRKEATNGRAEEFARVTRELFGITVPEPPDEIDTGRPPSVP